MCFSSIGVEFRSPNELSSSSSAIFAAATPTSGPSVAAGGPSAGSQPARTEGIFEQLPWPSEPGPRLDLDEKIFWATSERCGRRMQTGEFVSSWRWTGFHFGLDVVIKYKRRVFYVIRFTEPTTADGAVSHALRHRLLLFMRVISAQNKAFSEPQTISDQSEPTTDPDRNRVGEPADASGEFRTAEVSGTPDFASFNAGAYFSCPHVVSTPGVLSL
ncbi:unnamed protein product, partial [Protopolystoma xenopodis]